MVTRLPAVEPPPLLSPVRHAPPSRVYPRYLLPLYVILIVYSSLSPFTGWKISEPGTPHFMRAAWPRHLTSFDVVANVLAYVPLGILLFDLPRPRFGWRARVVIASLSGFLLSFSMETLQAFLPVRFSSLTDLLANVAGTFAGAIVAAGMGHSRLARRLVDWRRQTFNEGAGAEFGEVLLAAWLFVQLNPSIPFFAAGTIINPMIAEWNTNSTEPLYLLPQSLAVALNVCGFGLFTSVLLRPLARPAPFALAVIACGVFLKMLAAGLLLKSPLMLDWFGKDTMIGIAGGGATLWLALHLSHRWRIYLAAMLLLAGGLLAKIAAIYNGLSATLGVFNWPYGQLFNFTSLTLLVNEFWPVVALIYLLIVFDRLPSSDATPGDTARSADV